MYKFEQLKLTWSIPFSQNLTKHVPWKYVEHVINSREKGSLNDYLSKNITGSHVHCKIESDPFVDCSENSSLYTLFSIYVILTKEAFDRRKDVLDAIFSSINKLRQEEPSEKVFNEVKKIIDFNQRFVKLYYQLKIFEKLYE